jgi:hypothetical protein
LAQPGKIERGARADGCKNHLHQLHVCLPAGPGRTRLLYRMSMDFLQWTRLVPGIKKFWASIAQQVPPCGCVAVTPSLAHSFSAWNITPDLDWCPCHLSLRNVEKTTWIVQSLLGLNVTSG